MIHELVLQKDDFYLVDDIHMPSGKLGLVINQIKSFRRHGFSIIDSINNACNIIHYYEKSITPKRIKKIISEGLNYYLNVEKYENDEQAIITTIKDKIIVSECVNNINNNRQIQNLLNPIDIWGDEILSFNEDAFFINFIVTHNDKSCVLKFKMKADN